MLTPLAAAMIANAAKSDVQPRVDRHEPDERHGDRVDRVGVLDLVRRDDRHDDEPQHLLAGADALAGLGVEVVVERAEAADEQQRRERRDDPARRQAPLRQKNSASDDADHEEAAHRRACPP